MKLEVVVIPVSDVDRAKALYERIGWRLNIDRSAGVEDTGLRSSPVPIVVARHDHVPFVFKPGKKVGGPRIAY